MPVTLSTSPFLTWMRQFFGVTYIDTSHETAPAGSKYLALDRNSRTLRLPRSR